MSERLAGPSEQPERLINGHTLRPALQVSGSRLSPLLHLEIVPVALLSDQTSVHEEEPATAGTDVFEQLEPLALACPAHGHVRISLLQGGLDKQTSQLRVLGDTCDGLAAARAAEKPVLHVKDLSKGQARQSRRK